MCGADWTLFIILRIRHEIVLLFHLIPNNHFFLLSFRYVYCYQFRFGRLLLSLFQQLLLMMFILKLHLHTIVCEPYYHFLSYA
nr:MAG TPA: hypothetical protein [Caudoviricetes sp.]